MSTTEVIERNQANGNGNNDRAMTVRPHQVGVAAEQQRAIAEVQAALTVAKADRRHEVECVDRIKTSCQRIGLAEKAEYVYQRGGTDITGPTIDLLTTIANCWGNIQFGFRELTQHNGESTVEAFAWDLETNSKRVVTFTVPHKRHTKQGSYPLTDPRDIYELVANQAQRRVRACLEAIIPPDVVEDAVATCRATLAEKAKVTKESIAGLIEAFAKLSVTVKQIETKLGRRLDAMQPAQLVNMRRIYKSITDGMSTAASWFLAEEGEPAKPQTATESAKESLRKLTEASTAATEQAAADVAAVADTTPVEESPAPVASAEAAKPAKPVRPRKATLDAIARMMHGMDEPDAVELLAKFGVEKVAHLSVEQAEGLRKHLEEQAGMFSATAAG